MLRRLGLIVLALLSAPSPAAAQAARSFSPEMVRPERLLHGVARYDLIQGDEKRGDWYLAASIEDGVYRLVDGTTLHPDIRESGVWRMSADSLAPLSVSLDGDFSRSILDVDLSWSDGRVEGAFYRRRPQESARQTTPFSQPARAGAIFRAAAFVLAATLDYSQGPIALTWFSSLSGRYEDITLVPEGEAEITTPAGVFQTRKIGVRGGAVENVLYLTQEASPRLVRVDIEGQDMRFEYRGAQ